MIGYVSAQQNTATNPYQDSKHTYRVKIGLAANVQEWTITDGTSTYDLLAVQPFAVTYVAGADGGYDVISITFDTDYFSAGNWALRFREIDNSNSCISAREFPITISANTFYYALAADNNLCNAETNDLHTYAQVRTDVPANVYPTPVTYTVTMNKDALFATDTFRFDLNFSQPITDDGVTVTTAAGVATVVKLSAASNTDYRISVVPSNKAITSATMAINVSYSNFVVGNAGGAVVNTMSLTNGLAVVIAPPAPDALTDDNIIGYSDGSPVRQQAITIIDVPYTNDILPGDNETATSAQNPMQNSTHKYKVAMGDYVNNYGNAGTVWYVESPLSPGVAITTGLSITRSANSGLTSTDTVSVAFTTLVEGNYILYFKEQNTNSCSTVRAYPFTLVGPFVVTLAENFGNNCATISDDVNNTPLTATTTEVIYTVSLPSGYTYYADWHFDFVLNSAPGFDADMNVSSIVVAPVAGVTFTSPTATSRAVTVASSVTSVTFTVTYSGLYENEHIITSLLDNITGSFNETVDDVSISRTIYSIPQAGILAGVD
jgi:hypothetical protein